MVLKSLDQLEFHILLEIDLGRPTNISVTASVWLIEFFVVVH